MGRFLPDSRPGRLTSPELLEAIKNGAKPTAVRSMWANFRNLWQFYPRRKSSAAFMAFIDWDYQSARSCGTRLVFRTTRKPWSRLSIQAAQVGEGYLVMRAVAARDAGRSLAEARNRGPLRLRRFISRRWSLPPLRVEGVSKSAAIMGNLAGSRIL